MKDFLRKNGRVLSTLLLLGLVFTFASAVYTYERLRSQEGTGLTWRRVFPELWRDVKGATRQGVCPTQLKRYPTVNVLVAGVDEDAAYARTDSLHVLRLYNNSGHAGVISIPRDSYVFMGDTTRRDKINAAYATGGQEKLRRTVENFLGVPMDHYLVLDLNAFVTVVDSFGGVEIDVEKRLRYTDRRGGLNIDLQPGRQMLNGEQAMGYVRFRHDRTGDFGRIVRQQTFAKEFLKQKATITSIGRFQRLYEDLSNSQDLQTNMTFCDFLYFKEFFEGQDIDHRLIPVMVPGEPRYVGAASVVMPDEQSRGELESLVLHQPTPVQFFPGAPVRLVNTCGWEARGDFVKTLLRLNGIRFTAVERQNRGQPDTTVVEGPVPPDMADKLNRFFKGRVRFAPAPDTGQSVPGEAAIRMTLGDDACRGLL